MKKALFLALACAFLLAESDNSMSLEVGVGYLTSTFTGKQSGVRNFKGKGVSRGVDIYIGANVYTTERFGVTFGTGAEFLNGGWNDECSGASGGVSMYNYSYTRQVLNYYLAKETSSPNYTEQLEAIKKAAGENDYDKPFDGTKGYLSKIETTQYVFKAKSGGEYVEKTDTDGSIIGTANKKYYELAKDGETGTHTLEQESAYLYRYNGAVYDGRGLYCSTPKLNVKTWYAFIGVFYDVLKFENFGVRAFGNVGVGYDMMKDRFSRATYYLDYGSYQGYYTANSNETPSQEKGSVYLPITAGIRFVIAKNHGIELVGKYNLIKSKWKSTQSLFDGDFNGYNAPLPVKIDTKITRDYSWGIRYVYEFKKDEGYY